MCAISRMKQSKKKKKNKSRATKPRKPKFLSLKEHLAPPQPQAEETSKMAMQQQQQQQDPNLNNPDSDSPVACLLEQDVEPDGGPTITDIFGSSSSNSSSAVVDEVLSPASPSVNWEGVDGDGLARRALRGRERWVFCRSKHKPSSSEIGSNTSRNAGVGVGVDLWGVGCRYRQQGLLLKLDYEEVLTAWSDRGSLYIDGEAPQVVPDLYHPCEDGDDDNTAPHVVVEVGNGGALRVPEMEEQSGKEGDRSSREARVMRYKEKRQSRLFAKRIRYEVRKRNAEKRPRIKGRFVKRVDAI